MTTKRYIHFFTVLVVFVATLVAYSVWYSKVGQESALAASLAGQIQDKKQSSTRVEEAKQQLKNTESNEAAVQAYFVDTADVVPFLESIQKTGAQLGTKVSVDSVSAQQASPHTVLQLSLRVTGSFDGVMRTLGAIEYQPYDTVVSSVALDTPGGTTGAVPQWSAAISLRIGTTQVATTTPKKP